MSASFYSDPNYHQLPEHGIDQMLDGLGPGDLAILGDMAHLSQLLPPRPDPVRVNVAPALPGQFKSLPAPVSATLRIFVETNGTISHVQIVRSTGNAALDVFATNYVEAKWRFVPASAHGQPVPDWATVIVRFRDA